MIELSKQPMVVKVFMPGVAQTAQRYRDSRWNGAVHQASASASGFRSVSRSF